MYKVSLFLLKRFLQILKRIQLLLKTIEIRVLIFNRRLEIKDHGKTLGLNKKLENLHKGKKCFVIGNGPSLNQHDLVKLSNEETFVVNSFHLHKDLKIINPSYYVFADPLIHKVENENVADWWKEIGNNTMGLRTEFILPLTIKDTPIDGIYLKGKKKYYLDFALPMNYQVVDNFTPTGPVNYVQNVVILAIQAAIYMGFDKIILLGVDHNWLSHFKTESHFYEGRAKISNASDAFSQPYHWWLNAINVTFTQYKILKQIAEKKNIKILNASEGGVLDVFPMVKFSDTI